MYDITNAKTLNMVSEWCQMAKNYRKEIPILLVGNKLDLEEHREVLKEQVEKFKENHNISSSMEISLKSGENVEKILMKSARMSLKYVESLEPIEKSFTNKYYKRNYTSARMSERSNISTVSILIITIFIIVLVVLLTYIVT